MSGNDSEALIHYTESRMMEGDFATLLCRYGKDGHMHSISRTEERTQHYDLPCQGKYHRHQFIEIFYVMEGSFEQILLGEKRCFLRERWSSQTRTANMRIIWKRWTPPSCFSG